MKHLCLPALVVVSLLCSAVFESAGAEQVQGKTVQAPSGLKERLPAEAPVIGRTTRKQVEEQYKAFAVESGLPNLFWGRYRKSRWEVLQEPGLRAWYTYNLLMSFDENGVVSTCDTIPEDKLLNRFEAIAKERGFPALNLSQPIKVSGRALLWHASVELQLSDSGMSVTMLSSDPVSSERLAPNKSFNVPAEQLSLGKCCTWHAYQASEVALALQFSKETVVGKEIYLIAEPRVALTLVRWLDQVKQAKSDRR